jgi:hypothetical protein
MHDLMFGCEPFNLRLRFMLQIKLTMEKYILDEWIV